MSYRNIKGGLKTMDMSNLKGALGEIFLKQHLDEYKLIKVNYGWPLFNKLTFPKEPEGSFIEETGLIVGHKEHQEVYDNYMKERNRIINETYGTKTFPDFYIDNSSIFIEVKSMKVFNLSSLSKKQQREFPKLVKKGFKVFVVNVNLIIEKHKFEVKNMEWFFLTIDGQLKKTTENALKIGKQ